MKKTVDHYNIIMHCPEDTAGQQELARRVALVHAQTISEQLHTLSRSADEKVSIINEILKKRSETKQEPRAAMIE